MPNLIYRIVSACCALGYGSTAESLAAAIAGKVDIVVCNGSAIHAGTDVASCSERDLVRADLRQMVAIGNTLGCPVILGGGTASDTFDLRCALAMAGDVLAAQGVPNAEIAIVGREAPSSNGGRTGNTGVAPLITALNDGARFVIIDRPCDRALFASDMLRRGIDADLAYRVGCVLESGASARDPAAHFESLVAEIYDDRSTLFVSPASKIRPTSEALRPRPEDEAPTLGKGG